MNYENLIYTKNEHVSLVILVLCLSIVFNCFAQDSGEISKATSNKTLKELIGTWKLSSVEEILPDKKVLYPIGKNPTGYLMYDSTGHMSQQLMSSERPKIPLSEATRVEIDDIIAGFDAYSGTYSVNVEEGAIIYHVECSISPTLAGKDLKRKFILSGDELTIKSTFTGKNDNLQHERVIIWKRVK